MNYVYHNRLDDNSGKNFLYHSIIEQSIFTEVKICDINLKNYFFYFKNRIQLRS